jgi:hypothetical protein
LTLLVGSDKIRHWIRTSGGDGDGYSTAGGVVASWLCSRLDRLADILLVEGEVMAILAGVCERCRYWHRGGKALKDKYLEREVMEGFGVCSNGKWHKRFTMPKGDDWAGIPLDGIVTEYDEDWGFLVGMFFGCIHWEAANREGGED